MLRNMKWLVPILLAVLTVYAVRTHFAGSPSVLWLVVIVECAITIMVLTFLAFTLRERMREVPSTDGRPALSQLASLLPGHLPAPVCRAILMDLAGGQALWRSVSRWRSRQGDSTLLLHYHRPIAWIFVTVVVVDGLLMVLIHLSLAPGPLRTILDVAGVIGFAWLLIFIVSLHSLPHEVRPQGLHIRFAQLTDIRVSGAALECRPSTRPVALHSAHVHEDSLIVPVNGQVNVEFVLQGAAVLESLSRKVRGASARSVHVWVDEPQLAIGYHRPRA